MYIVRAVSISPGGLYHNVKSDLVNRQPFLVGSRRRRRYFDRQPAVPVMPETFLRLDLLLQQRSLNLSAITQTISNDVGATLQVMRATSEDRTVSQWPERRVEDCVVHLGRKGLRNCLRAVLSSLTASRYLAAKRQWRRARIAAELSQSLLTKDGGASPADAYVAGLFHEIGGLPALLGWTVDGIDLTDTVIVRRTLAEEWRLPPACCEIQSVPGMMT